MKKIRISCSLLLSLLLLPVFAQVQSFEYEDQNITDILFIFSRLTGMPVAADTTVFPI